jgi:hypothetical protein
MLRFGLVGYGKWGKILKKTLDQLGKVVFISNTKKSYKIEKKINFCFVASSDDTHFKIVKYFLKKKIPVFCEKPLTRELSKCRELILFSKELKTPIFIDHIEYFKNKIIKIKKNNTIVRKKKSTDKIQDILWKLCYHDLYLLYDHLNKGNLIIKLLFISESKLKFKIINQKKTYIFYYDYNSFTKVHKINNTNFISKKNYLKIMISDVINKKIDFKLNNKQAVFCIKTILKIKSKIFK